MQTSQVLFVCVLCVVLACVLSRSVPDYRNRVKRQYADMTISKHQANIGVGRLIPKACKEVACGLNIAASGKRKRSEDYALERDELDEIRRMALLQRVIDTLMDDDDS